MSEKPHGFGLFNACGLFTYLVRKISSKIHRNVVEFISRIWYNKVIEGCAGSVQTIQCGESSHPVKPSKQPVHSLGAEAARLGLSVGRGVREPQCESVKRVSPVINE